MSNILRHLNTWSPVGSCLGMIRSLGLLQEVCHWGQVLRFKSLMPFWVKALCFLVGRDGSIHLLLQRLACLPAEDDDAGISTKEKELICCLCLSEVLLCNPGRHVIHCMSLTSLECVAILCPLVLGFQVCSTVAGFDLFWKSFLEERKVGRYFKLHCISLIRLVLVSQNLACVP